MSVESLKTSLAQYHIQLEEVEDALKKASESAEIESLTSLQLDLKELITLTNENIETLTTKVDTNNSSVKLNVPNESNIKENELEDEYSLFMAEMSKSGAYVDDIKKTDVNDDSTEKSQINTEIEKELSSLEGSKCAVLYTNKWGGEPFFCNAMICSIIKEKLCLDIQDIRVCVLFTNPTHIEMIPCPYYLEGICKFDNETCKYSHGELVLFSSIREAIVPDFSSIKAGSRVIAKIKENEERSFSKVNEKYLLWHRAVILSVDFDNHICQIKLENNTLVKSGGKNEYTVDFGDIFPLSGDSTIDSDSDLSSDELIDDIPENSQNVKYFVERSLMNSENDSQKLGDWEKHTKGMGSKLMLKMGYIVGNGLGPLGTGRMQPVPCKILPVGKSLDHCMNLREQTSIDDPIKAEKKLRKIQKRKELVEIRASERAKEKEKHNVFHFLNNTLSEHSKSIKSNKLVTSYSFKKDHLSNTKDLKNSSCKNLNIEQLKLAEEKKKIEKDISKLNNSILRNSGSKDVQNGLKVKLNSKLAEMKELQVKENKITNEQTLRKDQKKLTIF